MGANASSPDGEGILVVSSGEGQPLQEEDTILRQIRELKQLVPQVSNDKETVWEDLKIAGTLQRNCDVCASEFHDLLLAYERWTKDLAGTVAEKQAEIHKKIDHAEALSTKVMKHTHRAAHHMEQVSKQLAPVATLPDSVQWLDKELQDLEAKLDRLQRKAGVSVQELQSIQP